MDLVQTPIEQYELKGRTIHVKRDDLVGDGIIMPRWSKIEGIKQILKSDTVDKSKPLVHLSVYGSWTGWVLSELCKEVGIKFISAYPESKKFPMELLDKVKENGAELYPMKPNMMKILENQLKTVCKEKGWQMLPYAFNHPMYVKYMGERMKEVLEKKSYDHLVVSMGSGVTACGLIKEFLNYNSWQDLLSNDKQVHSITMSSLKSTRKILAGNGVDDLNNIHIYESEFAFDDMMKDYEVPFNCNEFWDKKMWYWLEQNIDSLEGDILFWNIGGKYLSE
jgi:hypothetical protein